MERDVGNVAHLRWSCTSSAGSRDLGRKRRRKKKKDLSRSGNRGKSEPLVISVLNFLVSV